MGKFVIEKGHGGHYFFKLISSGGENIFTSENYYFKTACKHAIENLRVSAMNFLRYELATTYDGKYYFRIHASSGHPLGRSCFCDTPEKRNYYVEKVKNSSPFANLVDLTRSRELNVI
jgi:uncharacterized protein YegP (UPF0339 family)